MSLILGIYSKKRKIEKNNIDDVLVDFSLQGKRKLRTKAGKKIIFSSMVSELGEKNIVENEDKSLILVIGGEIFGFGKGAEELAEKGHSFKDKGNGAEYILHSYEEFGDSFLKELNGTFSFAIYDRTKDELILGNDSFGIYPMFVYNGDNYVIFSSEFEPLARYGGLSRELDYDAVAEYFSLGLPLGEKTFLKEIKNMHPGSVIRVSGGKFSTRQYANMDIKVNRKGEMPYFAREASRIISKAVQSRMAKSAEYACNLTGGADTRLILSSLTKEQREQMSFMTRNSAQLEPEEDRDVIIARMLADRLHLDHEVTKEKFLTEEFGPSYFDRRRILPSAKRKIGGLHGGEFLGGCCYTMSPINIGKIRRKDVNRILERVFSKNFLRKVSDPYANLERELRGIKAENKELYFCIRQITRGFFTSIYGGSRAGWLSPYYFPTRITSVFWDREFLEFLLTVPREYLENYRLYNQVYKDHFPELTGIPTNSDLAKRNDSCIRYIKSGKEPKKARKPRYSTALRVFLRDNDTNRKEFYNSRFVFGLYWKAMLGLDNGPMVRRFIDFEAWYRRFVSEVG